MILIVRIYFKITLKVKTFVFFLLANNERIKIIRIKKLEDFILIL